MSEAYTSTAMCEYFPGRPWHATSQMINTIAMGLFMVCFALVVSDRPFGLVLFGAVVSSLFSIYLGIANYACH